MEKNKMAYCKKCLQVLRNKIDIDFVTDKGCCPICGYYINDKYRNFKIPLDSGELETTEEEGYFISEIISKEGENCEECFTFLPCVTQENYWVCNKCFSTLFYDGEAFLQAKNYKKQIYDECSKCPFLKTCYPEGIKTNKGSSMSKEITPELLKDEPILKSIAERIKQKIDVIPGYKVKEPALGIGILLNLYQSFSADFIENVLDKFSDKDVIEYTKESLKNIEKAKGILIKAGL